MSTFKQLSTIFLIAAFTLLIAMVLPGTAQENSVQENDVPQEITDSDLDNAAKAYAQMQVIHGEFQQSVQQTEDNEARQQLQNQANDQLIQAIQETGLDVDTFNHIMAQIQTDDELRETFIEKVEDIQ
jgi:predicted PurR-regulated permease PerM